MHRFFLLVLLRDFPGGRAYFILPRIGRTYPGPPPEVEGLVTTKDCGEFSFDLLCRHQITPKMKKPLKGNRSPSEAPLSKPLGWHCFMASSRRLGLRRKFTGILNCFGNKGKIDLIGGDV
jgi:hypothetical protein